VILPQFTVARNTTVRVAERSATSKITIATPRPAVSQLTSFTVLRGGRAGSATNISWAGDGGQFSVATNVPVYNKTYGGWVTVAGTSIAAPLIAGIYGVAGNGDSVGTGRLYGHASSFFDITKGNNSFFEPASQACGDDYLCVAKTGYDAPTGLGTPDGTGAF
jgi:hypothetical protein